MQTDLGLRITVTSPDLLWPLETKHKSHAGFLRAPFPGHLYLISKKLALILFISVFAMPAKLLFILYLKEQAGVVFSRIIQKNFETTTKNHSLNV